MLYTLMRRYKKQGCFLVWQAVALGSLERKILMGNGIALMKNDGFGLPQCVFIVGYRWPVGFSMGCFYAMEGVEI